MIVLGGICPTGFKVSLAISGCGMFGRDLRNIEDVSDVIDC